MARKPKPKKYYCTCCEDQNNGQEKGSALLLLALFLFCLPIFVIYVIVISTRRKICANCGRDTLIPNKPPKRQEFKPIVVRSPRKG